MKWFQPAAALGAGLAFLLVGCGGDNGGDGADIESGLPTDDEPAGSSDPAAADPDDLTGRAFVAVSVTEDGDQRELVEGTTIEINFPDDGPGIGWSAGCNHFGADLEVDGDRLIVVDPPLGTLIGCEEERQAQDEWLTEFLTAEPTWTLDDDALTLETESTLMELEEGPDAGDGTEGTDAPEGDDHVADTTVPDQPPAEPEVPAEPPADPDDTPSGPADLDGTWDVTELIDGGNRQPVDPGVEATVSFRGDQLGLEACNTGGAQIHEITGDEIEVDTPITTMMACGPPLDSVERAIVTTLDGRISYTLDGDRLTLTHPDGHGLVLTARN